MQQIKQCFVHKVLPLRLLNVYDQKHELFKKLCGLCPQANCSDRAPAARRRS
jgi:hypothetical protein